MRRVLALTAAIVLLATFAGGSAASATVPEASSFVGQFELTDGDGGPVVGWANVEARVPTTQNLVPGSYDFTGAVGNWIRESHAVIGSTSFWFDEGHGADSYVAYIDGVECIYSEPGAKFCHAFTGMFVDPLDPAASEWVEFRGQDPDTLEWTSMVFYVGRGAFVLHCVAATCPTNP